VPTCTGAPIVKPSFAQMTLAVRIGLIGVGAIEAIAQWWPFAVGTEVLAVMPTDVICSTNPSDPGPFNIELVKADLTEGFFPSINSQSGTLGWWIFQKALYALFVQACDCPAAEPVPPQPVAPNIPSSGAPYPTGDANQPQINRIEKNTATNNPGLTTIYNGVLSNSADLHDIAARIRPAYLDTQGASATSISGEGHLFLNLFNIPGYKQIPERAGVLVHVNQLPTVYKTRGTLLPRYYGIGSIYWTGLQDSSTQKMVVRRDSIHYIDQFFAQPPEVACYEVYWRLMPGAVVTLSQQQRYIDAAVLASGGYTDQAASPLSQAYPPAGWTDAPFYNNYQRSGRVYALGAPG